jgi:hypothetical protein
MTTAYDAGVLIGADAGQRRVWADHRARLESGLRPITTAPVVAQVSRSPRQVQLRLFLRGCDIRPMTENDAHPVGALLAATGTSDVVDAHLVHAAVAGAVTTILTSDVGDIVRLVDGVGARRISVRAV